MSIELTRLLGAAQEGGSAVAECLAAAGRIDCSDDRSWYREWTKIADTNRKRGHAALEAGNTITARSNWLRAANYYQAAAFPCGVTGADRRGAIESMRECARNYLAYRNPPGEVVAIAWPDAYPLEGYFLPAPQLSKRGSGRQSNHAPVVICIGEPGQRKEECLYKVARHAGDRGMSLLAVDLWGAGSGDELEADADCPRLERVVGHIMDYVVERGDADERRVAILADGWSSSFVARGIAFDDRFAAAVCDGGIWDLHEQAILRDRAAPRGVDIASPTSRAARGIKCPVLVPAGERGWLKDDRIREFYQELKAEGRDITLKIFTAEETAAAQGHADNPTLANEFIFDWIAARFDDTRG